MTAPKWLHFGERHILRGKTHHAVMERRGNGQYFCEVAKGKRVRFAKVVDSYTKAQTWCERELREYEAKEASDAE